MELSVVSDPRRSHVTHAHCPSQNVESSPRLAGQGMVGSNVVGWAFSQQATEQLDVAHQAIQSVLRQPCCQPLCAQFTLPRQSEERVLSGLLEMCRREAQKVISQG